MKLIIAVSMIRFIIALFDKKTKTKNTNAVADNTKEVQHPAAFRLR